MNNITVIGGGIIGLTTSYILSNSPESHDVTLIEKEDALGARSTDKAGCGLRTVYRHPNNIGLAKQGLLFWKNVDDVLGYDIGLRENGYMFLTNQRDAQLKEEANRQIAYGLPVSYEESPQPTDELINSSNYSAKLYSPIASLASPELMTKALKNNLSNTDIRLGESVIDILQTGDKTIVETDRTEYASDYVINASGAWANKVAQMVNVQLPISVEKRRLSRLSVSVPEKTPLTVDIDSGVYILPDTDGKLYGGGNLLEKEELNPDSKEAFTNSFNKKWNRLFRNKARRLSSRISKAEIVESWTGLYVLTESRVPIIERTGNVIHAAGFSGHGIMQAPGAAQQINKMIQGIGADSFDMNRNPEVTDIQF
jgi:sarcosine oxidase subunit beta